MFPLNEGGVLTVDNFGEETCGGNFGFGSSEGFER
jgi:hypothetical protein